LYYLAYIVLCNGASELRMGGALANPDDMIWSEVYQKRK